MSLGGEPEERESEGQEERSDKLKWHSAITNRILFVASLLAPLVAESGGFGGRRWPT
jgi:hypothetical protein